MQWYGNGDKPQAGILSLCGNLACNQSNEGFPALIVGFETISVEVTASGFTACLSPFRQSEVRFCSPMNQVGLVGFCHKRKLVITYEIRGSHDNEDVDASFLGCNAVWTGGCFFFFAFC
jgi:hypothetical protein